MYSTENQAVVGKYKNEMEGKIITEFVGLRSKLYSLTIQDEVKQKKVAKGVEKCVIEKKLKFIDYDDVLEKETEKREHMNFIKSKKHNVNTIKVNKICLSCFDNKKYLLNDGITSYAYGHYKIKEYEKININV